MSRKRTINQLSDLDQPIYSTCVHGGLTDLSPVKKGKKSDYFEGTLSDGTSNIRLVGFEKLHAAYQGQGNQIEQCSGETSQKVLT